MKPNLFLFLLLFTGMNTYAQLKVFGLSNHKPLSANNTRISTNVLTLPLWEDFSTSVNFPDTSIWRNSQNVSISDGLGNNLPSIGTATFDGLDSTGTPYSSDASSVDYTDSLTSKPIDLSTIAVASRSSVYLSFFYQKKGNGELPDDEDFISLDFKAANGDWVRIWPADPALLEPDPDIFTRVMIPVVDSLFHSDFQFRFRSFGRRNGPFDTWIIDYIYFDEGRAFNDFDFLDRAITTKPTNIFDSYTAIPIRQFFKNPDQMEDSTYVQVINYEISQPVQGIEYSAMVYNTISGNLIETLVDKKAFVIQSLEKLTLPAPMIDEQNLLAQVTGPDDSLYLDLVYFVDTGDTLLIDNIDPGTGDTTYIPGIDLRVNDTITRSFILDDFYAYDDGTAEFGAGVNQSGGQLAYQFIIDEPDTLVSLDMYFPSIGSSTAGLPIEIFIVSRLDDADASEIFRGNFTVQPSGINEFKTYQIIPPVVVGDSIFIGFKQTSDDFINLGLDKNNNSGDRMYFNITGSWEPNTEVFGSLMLRPRFGSGDIITSIEPEIQERLVSVYPNPVTGILKINGSFDTAVVYSLMGKPLRSISNETNGTEIDFSNLPNGLYLAKIIKGNQIQIERIIKY